MRFPRSGDAMRIDYGTLISPYPIKTNMGFIRKPKLSEIADIGFDTFNMYESFLKLTPETYYTKQKNEELNRYWNSLSEDERLGMTLYSMVIRIDDLRKIYLDVLNFFFDGQVFFAYDLFIIARNGVEISPDIGKDDICGVIHEKTFSEVLHILQQICCIAEKEEQVEELQFKNALARKLYAKMQNAQKKQKEVQKADKNKTLPNLISAVSNSHPSISPITVWDLTVYQLMDAFIRLEQNVYYKINSTSISVWGDKEKKFDYTLWYKNYFDD